MRQARHAILTAAALILGLSLLPQGAQSQPHAPPPKWKDPAGPPVETDVWLRRLIGRFQFEGTVHVLQQGDCAPLPPANSEDPPEPFTPACQPVSGMGDCIGIGSGPGVQCVLNVQWEDLYDVDQGGGTATAAPGAVSYLDPSMVLFGLDPFKSAINYLLVDHKGMPEGGPGHVNGRWATFTTPCVNEPVGCQRTIRIEANPEARLLYMWISIEDHIAGEPITNITLTLRRIAQAGQASAN